MLDRWIRSLCVRLWATNVVALAVCLAVMSAVVIYGFRVLPERMISQREQTVDVRHVAHAVDFDAAGRPVAVRLPGSEAWLFRAMPTQVKYRVLDETGRVLLASTGAENDGPWLAGGPADHVGRIVHLTINGEQYAIATQPISHGASVFYAQTKTSTEYFDALAGLKMHMVRVIFFVVTFVFALTLPLTIHGVLKPLRQASTAAAQITPHNLTTRLSTEGVPTEIKPLIGAFNDALGRLEHGFTVQQQFLAAAAHELQTPLTLLRGQVELQPGITNKDQLFREIDLMARQVRQLLHLAEVSESQNFSFREVNSVDVAQDVVGYLARKADARQVKLQLQFEEASAPPLIWADGSALFIMVKNLVENAINASPSDGVVSLVIEETSIQVRDQGHGIPDEHMSFLFKRFWRAPNARYDGAGLGLAICREIALAHEWRLTVDRLAVGTQFTVGLR